MRRYVVAVWRFQALSCHTWWCARLTRGHYQQRLLMLTNKERLLEPCSQRVFWRLILLV